MAETLVPMNFGDGGNKMKKSTSFGSDKDLNLHTEGEENTLDYRIAAKSAEGKNISLWHDINLVHIDPETGKGTPYYNFVCEIPKFTRKKYEIATDEDFTPIKQDEKKGTLREVG